MMQRNQELSRNCICLPDSRTAGPVPDKDVVELSRRALCLKMEKAGIRHLAIAYAQQQVHANCSPLKEMTEDTRDNDRALFLVYA